MIEIRELDRKAWNKGYAYSVTYNKSYNETYLHSEISQISPMYSLIRKVRKTGDAAAAKKATQLLCDDDFLHNDFFKNCILVPVPGLKPDGASKKLAEEAGKLFNIPVNDAFSLIYMDETVFIERNKTRTRKHPSKYLVNKDFFKSLPKETRVIVFDDIYDEGDTMQAAAEALTAAGVHNVDIFAMCLTREARSRSLIIRNNK